MSHPVKPNFFVAGAPKCGTTSLHFWLGQHPEVYTTPHKGLFYFSDDFPGLVNGMTEDIYLSQFAGAQPVHKARGEASISYLHSATALQRIMAFDAEAKVIVMLRNPVELVYSMHDHALWTLNEDVEDFNEAWNLQEQRLKGASIPKGCRAEFFLQYRELGALAKYLRKALEVVPREQLFIGFFDDLVRDPVALCNEIFIFLGMSSYTDIDLVKLNANKRYRSRVLGQAMFGRLGKALRMAGRLTKKLPEPLSFDLFEVVRLANLRENHRAPMPPETRAMLVDVFRDQIIDLQQITGRDLSPWLAGELLPAAESNKIR